MWLLASVVHARARRHVRVTFMFVANFHVDVVPVSCAKILRKARERSSLSPTSLRRHHIACLHPGTSTLRVRGCAEGMPTFSDKSREQLVKARASAPTAAGYNRLDDSHYAGSIGLAHETSPWHEKRRTPRRVIQRRYRSYVSMWRHYGPSAFVGRQPDQIANFGKVLLPVRASPWAASSKRIRESQCPPSPCCPCRPCLLCKQSVAHVA